MTDFKEFFSPYMDRIKSPFFGTFVIVWILCNWRFFIKLYNLPINEEYDGQITFIQSAINEQGTCKLLVLPMFYTLVSLVGFYITNAAGLFVKELYNMHLKPRTLYLTGKSAKIVSRDEYDRIKKEHKLLDERYTVLDKMKGSILTELSTSKESKTELEREKNRIEEDNEKNISTIETLKSDLETEKLEKEKMKNQIEKEREKYKGVNAEFEGLKDEIKSLYKHTVLYGIYGINEKVNDVTTRLQNVLNNGSAFKIGNQVFGPDPAPGVVKYLTILYWFEGKVKSNVFTEHNFIRRSGEKITEIKKNRIVSELSSIVLRTEFPNKLNEQKVVSPHTVQYNFSEEEISVAVTVDDDFWYIYIQLDDNQSNDYLDNVVFKHLKKHKIKPHIDNGRAMLGKYNVEYDWGTMIERLRLVLTTIDNLQE